MKLLVTGGAGFIGSAFVRMAIEQTDWQIVNLDKLTYAGNLENLATVERDPHYRFVLADLCDEEAVRRVFEEERPHAVVHFAAESHVDRTILSPEPAFMSNVGGTMKLLEAARKYGIGRFVQISTDEVYGSLPEPLEATEEFPIRSNSPYSASKAASDALAMSYYATYKLPVMITRAANNYGPYQFPEKLIPLMIANALEDRPLPVYGDGMQVRDWLYVDDHCRGIMAILANGREGEIYNIGGNRSLPNIEVVTRILKIVGKPLSLIQHVGDRPGHDRRYALTSAKLARETGWRPDVDFETGLARTIDWYRSNPRWVARVRSGEYRAYYEQNYGHRAAVE